MQLSPRACRSDLCFSGASDCMSCMASRVFSCAPTFCLHDLPATLLPAALSS